MYRNSWDFLRRNQAETAFFQMRANVEEKWNPSSAMPSMSGIMELGIGYLWLKDYQSAISHFDRFNEQYPNHIDSTYEMAGVAYWCLGHPARAVEQWREGLSVAYGDSAGLSIKPSLLLLFASVIAPELYSRENAMSLLANKSDDARCEEWPLVPFVLGKIDESELRAKCDVKTIWHKDPRREEERRFREWQADFWTGVMALSRGEKERYFAIMNKVGNLTWDDFDENRNLFLSKLWKPEFFLARHEEEQVGITN